MSKFIGVAAESLRVGDILFLDDNGLVRLVRESDGFSIGQVPARCNELIEVYEWAKRLEPNTLSPLEDWCKSKPALDDFVKF